MLQYCRKRLIARRCQEIPQTGYRPESRNTRPHSRERGFGSWAGQKAREHPPERSRPRIVLQGAAFPSHWRERNSATGIKRNRDSVIAKSLGEHPRFLDRGSYWSFHNLGDISLFTMKVMFYILWYAPGWEDITAQYIGRDALSCYRSAPSRKRCRGDREAARCTLGQCITLAYKMAPGWREGS